MTEPFFSICIPVYKKVTYLRRLLESVRVQTFTHYELVITDDSADETVKAFLEAGYADLPIVYYRNLPALGTPENWNEGMRRASGQWIKLMHDDDWFATETALETFHDYVNQYPEAAFFFTDFNNVPDDSSQPTNRQNLPLSRWNKVQNAPEILYARNIIGPPSVTLVNKYIADTYDRRFKWLVDLDYYIRVLRNFQAAHIPEAIINIGLGSQQVTQYTLLNPAIEIPEGLLLYQKLGIHAFERPLYFDAWWRLIRNLKIKEIGEFEAYAPGVAIPLTLKKILLFQSNWPTELLKFGPFSKILMVICWIFRPGK